MKFLKKMFSKQQKQESNNYQHQSSNKLDKENLDEVMNYALRQIELAKTNR